MRETTEMSDSNVRLESVTISDFRSCRRTVFDPNKDLSTLIGINGVGKTNILHGLRLLDTRRGRSFTRKSDQNSVTGAPRITAWFNFDNKKIGFRLTMSSKNSGNRVEDFSIEKETWNLKALNGPVGWVTIPPMSFLRKKYQGKTANTIQRDIFGDNMRLISYLENGITSLYSNILENKKAIDAVIAIDDFRSSISYYGASQFTDPSRCPSSFEVNEQNILAESYFPNVGHAHLHFLHDLYSLRRNNRLVYEEYCRFVSRKQLGLVSRITWKEIELSSNTAEVKSGGTVQKIKKRKTLVIPKIQIGKSHITFNQLSEGTFKTLALIFYIINDTSKFLMIEEPEVCIHHGLLKKIIQTIKSYSHTKQTVISTHSDLLVDELEPRNIFVVDMGANGTQVKGVESWLTRGGRDALHKYLQESGPLGEYLRSGGLS